jgi:ribonuclease BN (tRNA processing enzyme)
MSEKWKLHFCGVRGSRPVCGEEFLKYGGATTCYILQKEDYALIMDCGSGLERAGEILKDCKRIDIFLTHLHYDHIIGLLGWGVFPKNARIRFFGTFDRWFGEKSIEEFFRPPFWPVVPQIGRYISVSSPGTVGLDANLKISCYPSNHPNDASVFRVDTDGKNICVLCDYEHGSPLPEEVTRNCDLLIYDGMYTDQEYPGYKGWGHSSYEEGIRLAKERGIGQLYIAHHAPDRTDAQLTQMEAEAQKCFPALHFAKMGDVIVL